jgi:hypothetical protein
MRTHGRSYGFLLATLALSGAFVSSASASNAEEMLIVPGQSVGKVRLGMSPEQVKSALGEPQTKTAESWEYHPQGAKDLLRVLFAKQVVVQIEFTSHDYHTEDQIDVRNYRKFREQFRRARFQGQFLHLRYSFGKGGLSFFEINYDSTSPTQEPYSLGVVHSGATPAVDPLKGATWADWEG